MNKLEVWFSDAHSRYFYVFSVLENGIGDIVGPDYDYLYP